MEYWHNNNPKIIRDLGLTQKPLTAIKPGYQFNINGPNREILYVNTYLGVYGDICLQYGGCNPYSLTESWQKIFNEINTFADSNLTVKENFDYYVPEIDYNQYDVANIDRFFETIKVDRCVLFCNDEPLSSQSFVGDMKDIIVHFASQYSATTFFCTKRFDTTLPNIVFTDHLTNRVRDGNDLNEISYLSTKCNAIIGRNSGPFVFSEIKENFQNPRKHFLSFNGTFEESLSNSVYKRCHYTITTNFSARSINQNINNIMRAIYEA
jgi:hypothetical protein